MIRVVAIATAVLVAASLGLSGAIAQPKTDTSPSPAAQPKMEPAEKKTLKVEGKIKSVDRSGMVTLEDGTKLSIPKTVTVPKDQLKPGAVIQAEYEEKSGQKVATSVQIKS